MYWLKEASKQHFFRIFSTRKISVREFELRVKELDAGKFIDTQQHRCRQEGAGTESARVKCDQPEGEKKYGGKKNAHVADLAHGLFLVFFVHGGNYHDGDIIDQKEIG